MFSRGVWQDQRRCPGHGNQGHHDYILITNNALDSLTYEEASMSSLSTHSMAAAALMRSLQFVDNVVMGKLIKKAAISHVNIVKFLKKQRQQDDNVDMISPPPSPPPLPPPLPPTSAPPPGPPPFSRPKKKRYIMSRYQSTPNGAGTTICQKNGKEKF